MSIKYSVVAVAYKDVTPDVEAIVKKHSIREIDEPSDVVEFSNYGRQFDQDARAGIYLEWYQKNILKHLAEGYNVVLLEIPYSSDKSVMEVLNSIDEKLGDHLLVIEHDEV
ncbi:hypothetical protein [Fusibacter sp. 3D3]|uniref:hypothetical protein n=1 Tax=Fusibacter sp. 3D3 TaxID=1048380 RepID=UPI000852A875|nr:hypothetical protein [Fusibacter sp. 3D3]GAU78143.1 hypothetical protein F3D3_2775 [Fusibacter sp. 3D3]